MRRRAPVLTHLHLLERRWPRNWSKRTDAAGKSAGLLSRARAISSSRRIIRRSNCGFLPISPIMKIAVLGVDLGKNVCSLVGLDDVGVVIVRRRARRDTLIDFVAKLPACIVGMEACCGAHHLGRLFAAQGHDARLMSPEYMRPYVKEVGSKVRMCRWGSGRT